MIIDWIRRRKFVATQITISSVSFENIKIKGNIMSVSLGGHQQVLGTVTGSNTSNPNAPINTIQAASSDAAIFSVGAIDQTAQTVNILGVAQGTATLTVTALNINGATLTATVDVTITPDLVATVLTIVFGTPVSQ